MVKVAQSYLTLCDSPWNFPGQNTGVGSLSLLQGIFPTQGLNLGLPHGRQFLYQLSHKGELKKKFVLFSSLDFPGGSDGKVSAYNAGDQVSVLGLGRFPGEGNGNPLQYSCLENLMDRGTW